MTASPSPPQVDQVEAAQPKEPAQVLYEALWPSPIKEWDTFGEDIKDRYRRGVAALRPVTSVAPEGMRFGIASEAGEAAFLVWEKQFGWVWDNERQRQGAITAFVAGWTGHESAALPPASGSDHGPVGWRLVPEVATPEMLAAAETALADWRKTLDRDEAMMRSYKPPHGKGFIASATPQEKHAIRYRAMLQAAPTPGATK